MVSLSEIYTSNALITSSLPPRLVSVFVGGTSGIGESTLKAFVSYAVQPKVYIVGRNNASAERIIGECRFLGPEGHVGEAEVIFLQADLSSMKTVEGVLTPEGLHAFLATAYYDRILIIHLLAPLLLSATDSHPGLARVVSVACGCDEGIIEPSDFSALRIPSNALRGHIGTLTTLTLEALATNIGPDNSVTFIHANPGLVRTPYQDRMTGAFGVFARGLMWVKKITGEAIGIEESGERQVERPTLHLYLLTSARYPPGGVPIKGEALSAIGTNGLHANEGSKAGAVYSVDKNGEPAGEHVVSLLTRYREEGMVDRLWVWLKGEYYRVGVVLS
ncbi:hypothetical protein F5050DRAFT_1578038 [Lentinula boryana]|uniref:NAD(P)-binding protein n=1 Tax=Lentinula boryana TaxID=40481 RepID=A0ABQ8Q4C0_9AGAR|nr:hypothetical protein F5050DRAFT_1578038 [Lentinula boryana]